MTRGRKPTPTHLRLVRGNPSKRPIPINDLRLPSARPACPRHLTGEARKEWNRLVRLLPGVITHADRGALTMICTTWARFIEAELAIKALAEKSGGGTGLFVKSPKGYPMQSPWLAVSNRAQEMYARLCVEFGLTPSARTRVEGASTMQPAGLRGASPGGWDSF